MSSPRSPRINTEQVGKFFQKEDGSVWLCQSYCALPTASFVRVYPAPGFGSVVINPAAIELRGPVGSSVFEGLVELEPKGGK